jgi:hypothetical protein
MTSKKLGINMLSLIPIMLLMSTCLTGPQKDEKHSINPNIIKLVDCCDRDDEKYVSGHFYLGQISGDVFIATSSITRFSLDSNYGIASREDLWRDFYENNLGGGNYFDLSDSGNQFLFTKTTTGNGIISRGALYEYDLSSKQVLLLKDSTYNVSTAVYWHGDDNKLIYYSYGNDDGLHGGYYLHDKITSTDSLLMSHRSEEGPFGPYDKLNGFDLSPDNRKLLVPNIRASFTGGPQPPRIIEFDFNTLQADTFDVAFDLSFVRIGLWLRYSPDGNRILYCQYPMNPFGTANDDSEIGIIELPSRHKRVLDVNTSPRFGRRSVQLAPTWSPDGQHIVYGSGTLFMPEGRVGTYSLYILKNVDDPINYK